MNTVITLSVFPQLAEKGPDGPTVKNKTVPLPVKGAGLQITPGTQSFAQLAVQTFPAGSDNQLEVAQVTTAQFEWPPEVSQKVQDLTRPVDGGLEGGITDDEVIYPLEPTDNQLEGKTHNTDLAVSLGQLIKPPNAIKPSNETLEYVQEIAVDIPVKPLDVSASIPMLGADTRADISTANQTHTADSISEMTVPKIMTKIVIDAPTSSTVISTVPLTDMTGPTLAPFQDQSVQLAPPRSLTPYSVPTGSLEPSVESIRPNTEGVPEPLHARAEIRGIPFDSQKIVRTMEPIAVVSTSNSDPVPPDIFKDTKPAVVPAPKNQSPDEVRQPPQLPESPIKIAPNPSAGTQQEQIFTRQINSNFSATSPYRSPVPPVEITTKPDSSAKASSPVLIETPETMPPQIGREFASKNAFPAPPQGTALAKSPVLSLKDPEVIQPASKTSDHSLAVTQLPQPQSPPAASPTQPMIPFEQANALVNESLGIEPLDAAHHDTLAQMPIKPAPQIQETTSQISAATPKNVAVQIAQASISAVDQGVEIALDPVELGKVRLTLHTSEYGITVQIQAERPETMDLMRRNAHLLEAEFEGLGYQDIGFDFSQNQNDPPPEGFTDPPSASNEMEAASLSDRSTPLPYQKPNRNGSGLDLRL